MSSLLDILHRRDGRTGDEAAVEPAPEDAAQTVELRLAVDNGPAEPASDPFTDPAATQSPATPESRPAPPPVNDPFATFAGPAGDATRVLAASRLQQRSRRSTALLATGLVVIVVGAGLATWLLNETGGLGAGDDALFTAPPSDVASATPGEATGTVERAAPAAAAADKSATPAARSRTPVATTTRRPKPAEPIEADSEWFDTPAVEEASGPAFDQSTEPVRITRGTTTNPLFPKLSEAWTAFQAADFARAEALYREVRAAEPGNVDALLGLGALAARGNRTDEAREYYQAVLLAEPMNATAISAMSTLPATGSRNLDESALKGLLRDQPGAANLHFALGLQYMARGRWPDAQTAFFDAVRYDQANADYAYNLAVSLDQLGQSGPAAAYYQRALELATASSLFNPGAAAERLATLRSASP
jgi:tetratricopeptide (TPR) repeat protein